MIRHWWKWLLALIVLVLIGWLYDRTHFVRWVGDTDLTVEFRVVSANSQQPIRGARIQVKSEGGFYEHRNENDFELVTDENGVARKVCRAILCSGKSSGLGFTQTFSTQLPNWYFQVLVDGFESSEWKYLYDFEGRSRARRTGPGKSKMVVTVSLRTIEK